MRGRGLKLLIPAICEDAHYVAPHAGAWIETHKLKLRNFYPVVAPHAGAWIETSDNILLDEGVLCRPPMRGRGLKLMEPKSIFKGSTSPPMRGCGLKPSVVAVWHNTALSPPMRGRGLKPANTVASL